MAKNRNRARSPQDRQATPDNRSAQQESRTNGAEAQPQASPADMARKQKHRFGHN